MFLETDQITVLDPTIKLKRTVIFNPFAKSERAGPLWYELYKVARKCKIKLTKGPGNATKKARKAAEKGSQVVIAAGGDGTINEVLNGIVGTNAVLGIIPIGSVNVLARQLKIPTDIEGAWKVIEGGKVQTLDLVKVEYSFSGERLIRYFLQLAGVGLDAQIVKKVTWERKMKWGPLSYVFETFRSINSPVPEIKVFIDDKEQQPASFVLIGNGNYYGGPISVFHKASMTDGLLDICLFQSAGYLDILIYLQAILRGTQSSTSGIRYEHGKKISLSSSSEVPLEIDGEFIGFLPAEITIIPKALKILAPDPIA
jgi:diacylglycerol kinase (ATP)